jgi:hypothetical protein
VGEREREREREREGESGDSIIELNATGEHVKGQWVKRVSSSS